jgi:rubrerythrin
VAILERAMQMERDGRGFYLWAAQNLQDADARQAFRNLADDEEQHFNLIRRQLDSLRGGGRWVDVAEIGSSVVDLTRSLFPRKRMDRETAMKNVATEADALLFGLEIESTSYDLYRKAAADTGEPLGRRMFEFLAGEEAMHFDVLMMRYEKGFGPTGWSA